MSWGDEKASKYLTYYGEYPCQYLYANMLLAAALAAAQVFYAYPDREDRSLGVGTGSAKNGKVCSSHPTHFGLICNDFDYYTFLQNDTHYPLGKQGTIIWDEPGKKLKTDVFDWERNYWFWKLMYNYNSTIFSTNDVIYNYVAENVMAVYGKEAYEEFKKIIPSYYIFKGVTYNHHLHSHGKGTKHVNDINLIKIERSTT